MTTEDLLAGDITPEQMTEMLKTPGGRLRFMRLTKGIKQTQLAERVHTTQASISLYETGARWPGGLMRQKLADELGVSVTWLWSRDTKAVA